MIVLDTHVWVWYAAGCDEISPRARQAIEEEALTLGAVLVTWDERLLQYPHARSLW